MAGKRREDEADEAEARANERDEKELKEGKVSVSEPKEEEEFEVKGQDDDEDDEDDSEPARPSRRERRRERGNNRVREAEERAAKAEENAAAERALLAQMIQQNRQVMERLAPPRPEAEDPRKKLENDFAGLEDQRQAIVTEYETIKAAGKMDQATHASFVAKDRALRLKIAEVQHRMFAPAPQPQMTPQQLQAATIIQRLRMDHGDVIGNPTGEFYFRGAYNQLRSQGSADSWETMEKAAAKARELMGIPPKGGRPAPTRGERAKFEGTSRSGGGGGGGGRATVRMTAAMKKMADAAYGHIKDERKRYQTYVNEHGNDPDFRS